MIQKMMIEVESSRPISSYGDGHILVLDGIKNKYYVTTREAFLYEQNKKIEDIKKKLEKLQNDNEIFTNKTNTDISNFKKSLLKENENFVEQMRKEYNDFLSQYKETNEKMIELIKSVIITEE